MATFDYHRVLLSNCPSIEYYEDRKIIFDKKENRLKNVIIESIDRDEYLFIYVDRFYLKIADEYHERHMPHEIFIYGYDLEENKVYVADNFQHGKFIFITCSFTELAEAYFEMKSDMTYCYAIRHLKVREYEFCMFNINQVINGLESYLSCSETFDVGGEFSKMEFGISVIDVIIDKVTNLNKDILDMRFFHLLYEHKLLMEMRVKFLVEHHYLEWDDIDLKRFRELKESCLVLRNLVLKYNILHLKCETAQNNILINRIRSRLLKIKREDIMLFSHLLWVLRKKRGR